MKGDPHPTQATAHLLTRRATLVAAIPAWIAGPTFAQAAYPNKALRVIVPQPPGGGFDFVARVQADSLSKGLGQLRAL